MAPTPDDLRAAVDRYVATVNGRDPGAIAALFTPDAVQADPASNPPNVGRDAIGRFFADGIAASDAALGGRHSPSSPGEYGAGTPSVRCNEW